tara:strand:- start:322 stop:3294 length:2973 start_codon:yes stop_codon:yes gene_type:complete
MLLNENGDVNCIIFATYMKYCLYTFALLLLIACSSEKEGEVNNTLSVSCDAEKLKGANFISANVEFRGGQSQSTDHARSGKHSVKLNKESPYGFTYEVKNIKKGDIIEASVWKHLSGKTGGLVISGEEPQNQYEFNQMFIEEQGEWGKIESFFVAEQDYKRVLIYALNAEAIPTYFDDIKIKGYLNNSKPDDSHEALEININSSAYTALAEFRKTALEQGVITKELKEYVDANLTVGGNKIPIELRLKGDWTDHLETNKWSFRIKIGGDNAYQGMKTFSIQNPHTRSFMLEWFAHRMYENEDVLTTRYIFVPVIINGKKMGVYALEEHFDKQLLEYRKRREGPIVKFDESGIWQLHYMEKNEHKYYKVPAFKSAEVTPFKKNRTNKSEALSKQFNTAKGQMELYRNHDTDVDDYFDVESLAKFIALSDVINGKHGLIWHNQRNYFNPVTNKLEPIAYDCFMAPNLIQTKVDIKGLDRSRKQNFTLIEAVLSNPKVEEKYFEYLKKFSSENYVDALFSELKEEIMAAETLLSFEYPNIKLNKQFFRNNAKQVREQLPEYEEHRWNPNVESEEMIPFAVLPENIIFTDIALKVNLEEKREDGSVTISFRNFHSADLEIIGYSTKANKKVIVPMPKITLKAYESNAKPHSIKLKEKPRRIHYRAKNCGATEFKAGIEKWGVAKQPQFLDKMAYIRIPVKGSKEVVLSGKNIFKGDMQVPNGYTLVIEAGAKIELVNNASIVSYSPLDIRGTKENPVLISSPDGTANGFVVISDDASKMNYAIFDNLNTMNKNGWTLTGAVTFYGGKVSIDNCEFLNNNCEDGLNLIRCEFTVQNSTISDAYSDGFDADFCHGKVSNSSFSNTGNDCLDFSGSIIEIDNCSIKNAGDKGISGGEGSELRVSNCSIDGSYIALAAKDLTVVYIDSISVKNSKYGFACYRKKPEYGPARIEVISIKKMDAENLKLLEKGSELIYLNKSFVGEKKFDIDSMYMVDTK